MPPKIASQNVEDEWQPKQNWMDEYWVQWGGGGLVIKQEGGGYRTAFFEVFPNDDSSGFIRGEGDDLDAAESHAYNKWHKRYQCSINGGHTWSRNRRDGNGKTTIYTNGGCFCLKCNSFKTVMKPIVTIGAYKKPLSVTELESMASGYCRKSPWSKETESDSKWRRKLYLRAKYFGIDLPAITPRPIDLDPFVEDEYENACGLAVAKYMQNHQELYQTKSEGGMMTLFDSLSRNHLRRLQKQHGLDTNSDS